MNDQTEDDRTTDRLEPVGYFLTRPPRDPYVGLVASAIVLVLGLLGLTPDDMSSADIETAVEGIGSGGALLFGLAALAWRRRVKHGGLLK